MWKLLQTILVLISLSCTSGLLAQKVDRIKYKADDLFEFRKDGEKIRRLIGNVVFAQETSTMYCDSSYYYVKDNIMEAFGKVRIVDDSVTITSRKLIYNGQDRTAKLRENVVYVKGDQRLTTNFLDYNMDTEVGNYFNGGKLKDSVNVLTSETGYYYGIQKYALFWDGVVLTAPDYVLKSDTLRYNTVPKIAITEGKTTIITEDESILHAKGGTFRTKIEQSEFVDGTVETKDYYMEGDELLFDDLKKYYDAKGNVKLTSKEDDVVITGDKGFADKANGISKVYGNALMRRFLEKDTLYLAADTLVSIESDYDSAKRILAYHNVRIWKRNLQGLADSAAYFLQDSMLYFYKDPIFWNLKNQLEGDTIAMEVTEKEIKNMSLLQNAFLATEDTLQNYNQIKGRTMLASFKRSEIKRIDVNGNGESIYYVLDEDDPNNIITLGMNRILCSDMTIRFQNEELKNISFYVKPEARFIPPHELTDGVQKLGGFEWRGAERPKLEDLLSDHITLQTEEEKPKQIIPPKRLNIEGGPKKGNDLLKSLKEGGE
ncbi:OstA-like protein [Ekhidna lutea]|uniref:OstA-like protein n=1 Tax=Ekhidna lutea TaxID=447679 RepID=A0A239M6A3_EKHLU|nr:OstA-like protein [Ekhidna lutea]SNT37643.1 OstA-like protein [Ekhidna lutea]